MLDWALKTLWQDRRFALSVSLGVALSLLLALLVEGIFVGESREVIAYPKDMAPDLWVAQEGVSNMHMTTSFINVSEAYGVADVEGVEAVTHLVYLNGFVAHGGDPSFVYIVGLDAPRAAPTRALSGKAQPGPGEVVLPRVLARKLNVGLGDEVTVINEPARIVGLVDGYYSMTNSSVFVEFGWLQDSLDLSSAVSFLLVDVTPETDPGTVAERLRRHIEGVTVTDHLTFLSNDLSLALQMGGELIAIMSVVSGLVAVLVVSWFVMLLVIRYQGELAIAKAVGAGNGQILMAVLIQAILLSSLGYVLSVACAIPLEPALARWRPDVAIHFPFSSFQRNGILTLAIAFIAALLPISRVLRVDPVEVFR